MTEELSITNASYVSDYKVSLEFNDGTEDTVDFGPFLQSSKNQEIRKYLDIDLFKEFRVIDGDLD